MTNTYKSEHSFDQGILIMSIENSIKYTFQLVENTGSSKYETILDEFDIVLIDDIFEKDIDLFIDMVSDKPSIMFTDDICIATYKINIGKKIKKIDIVMNKVNVFDSIETELIFYRDRCAKLEKLLDDANKQLKKTNKVKPVEKISTGLNLKQTYSKKIWFLESYEFIEIFETIDTTNSKIFKDAKERNIGKLLVDWMTENDNDDLTPEIYALFEIVGVHINESCGQILWDILSEIINIKAVYKPSVYVSNCETIIALLKKYNADICVNINGHKRISIEKWLKDKQKINKKQYIKRIITFAQKQLI